MDKPKSLEDVRMEILRLVQSTRNRRLLDQMVELLEEDVLDDFKDRLPQSQVNEEVIGYESDGNPITPTSLNNTLKVLSDEMDEGKSISFEEYKKESSTWI